MKYTCIKEITRRLKKEFKGIQANSYGFCCNSDYDQYHKYINENDYVCAKIYKGGLNNNYHNGKFELGDIEYFTWNLTNFKLEDVLKVMNEVANEYGYAIIKPEDERECIKIAFKTTFGSDEKTPFKLLDNNRLIDALYYTECFKKDKCFYVLHYDIRTTAYLNEIEFQTLEEAIFKYNQEEPLNEYDRVEMICSPENENLDNIVLTYKMKQGE